MSNHHLPQPEYRVNCLMCNQSFSATADTLGELVEIVALHLRQVEAGGYKPHQLYFDQHTDEKEKEQIEMLQANYRDDPSEILRSTLFRWDILRLVPYNKIFEVIETPLPTRQASPTAKKKDATQETVRPPIP